MHPPVRQRSALRLFAFVAILIAALTLFPSGCNHLDTTLDQTASTDFPVPSGLRPNVEFWRKVYAEWSRSQVVVHDDRYLDLIYQVAKLPGPIKASYTPQQRDFVDQLKARWRARLQLLSRKLARNAPLTSEERALRDKIRDHGGAAALVDPAERVRSQRGLRERFRRGIEISGRYEQHFREIFRRHGVPEDLAYLPHVESSFQLHARSSAGATGMWQFIRSTGRLYMTVNSQIDERLDPIISAEAAARYLSEAHRKLGSWPLAITSYNHGVAGMARAQASHGDDIASIVKHYRGRYFGFASRNFYAEFIAARQVAQHAKDYFPGVQHQPPLAHRRERLERSLTVAQLARHYQVPVHALIAANPAWLDPIRDGRAPLPAGSAIWVPPTKAPSQRKPTRATDKPLFGAFRTDGANVGKERPGKERLKAPDNSTLAHSPRPDTEV